MVYLVPSEDYPQVRALVNGDATAPSPSDAVLALPVYHDATEDWLASYLGAYPLSPTQTLRARRAGVRHLAALVAPTQPAYRMQRDASGTEEQMEPIDREAQAALLNAQAEADLRTVVAEFEPTALGVSTLLYMAPGRRGR